MAELREMRPFQRTDWIDGVLLCPHCNRLLKVIEAEGPYVSFDHNDNYWILTLEDGERARMWEDRKGVVVGAEGAANAN